MVLNILGHQLRRAKSTLERLYIQEQNAATAHSIESPLDLSTIRASRVAAEKRYINFLIRYCRDMDQMSTLQAIRLQRFMSYYKTPDLDQRRKLLLSIYPTELSTTMEDNELERLPVCDGHWLRC